MDKRDQMLRLVADYEQSGQSQRSFCQAAGLKLSQFGYWVRKVNKQQQQGAGFIEIDTHSPAQAANQIELVYPGGIIIRMKQADLRLIGQLLRL